MPVCCFCREEGHTVYECPICPPCDKCGKKGHRTEKCKTEIYVHKTHAKTYKPVAKKVVEKKLKNMFAMLDIELEEPKLEETKKVFDWWEEMKDDMTYLTA